jgi:hypothetical protein
MHANVRFSISCIQVRFSISCIHQAGMQTYMDRWIASSKPGTHELQFSKFSMPRGRPDQLPSRCSQLADLLQIHGNQRSHILLVKSEICTTRFRLPPDEIVLAFEKEKVNQDLSSSISSCTVDPSFRHPYTNFAGHACMTCDLIEN